MVFFTINYIYRMVDFGWEFYSVKDTMHSYSILMYRVSLWLEIYSNQLRRLFNMNVFLCHFFSQSPLSLSKFSVNPGIHFLLIKSSVFILLDTKIMLVKYYILDSTQFENFITWLISSNLILLGYIRITWCRDDRYKKTWKFDIHWKTNIDGGQHQSFQ